MYRATSEGFLAAYAEASLLTNNTGVKAEEKMPFQDHSSVYFCGYVSKFEILQKRIYKSVAFLVNQVTVLLRNIIFNLSSEQ